MTGIDIQTNAPRTDTRGTESVARKAILFCPICGHSSAIDGDWTIDVQDEHRKFTCPVCQHVVATR